MSSAPEPGDLELLPAGSVENAHILVVDDQALNRMMIKAALTKVGFTRITFACDGRQALEIAGRDRFDCILLDIMMPGIDGWTVCSTLRSDPRFRRIPIIIQTALSSMDDRRTAFSLGASDIISKPLDLQELVARVRVHVSKDLLASRLLTYRERIDAELSESRTVAETLLPTPEGLADLAEHGLLFDCHHRPSSSVGGDYWTAWTTREGKLGWLVGDVSGHGVSAALRASFLHALLMPPPPFSDDILRLTRHLDDRLYRHGRNAGSFVAAAYCLYDRNRGLLSYVAAGLRDGMIIRADGKIESLRLSGLPLGLVPGLQRQIATVALAPGDAVMLYTDAMVETLGASGPPADEEVLKGWVAGLLARGQDACHPPAALASLVAEAFLRQFGEDIRDDLLIVTALVR